VVTDLSGIPDGTYDMWVMAEDDRGLWGFAIVRVRVKHVEDPIVYSFNWFYLLLVIVVIAILCVSTVYLIVKRGNDT
jgi:hypothetical protein